MRTSELINEIAAASAKAQGQLHAAIKDRENPAFRSTYADLTAVWDACRAPLAANGLTCWQDVTSEPGGVSVVTRLAHCSGQWVEFGPLTIPLGKYDAHGVGSATSYAKRYALAAALGVVADEADDDGNAAVASAPEAPSRPSEDRAPRPSAGASGQGSGGGRPAIPVTVPQIKRLLAIARSAKWADDATVRAYVLKAYQVDSLEALTRNRYEQVCDDVQRGPAACLAVDGPDAPVF